MNLPIVSKRRSRPPVILEQHGYPSAPYSTLNRWDLLDHVHFRFQRNEFEGSIAARRDPGLHGRKPVFRNLRQLVWSYFDPYVDHDGSIKGYGLTSLHDLGNTTALLCQEHAQDRRSSRAIPHSEASLIGSTFYEYGTSVIKN